MKKILLSALLGVFGLVGAFTSATNYTFQGVNELMDYSPDSITFSSDISVPENLSDFIVSYSCESESWCHLGFVGNDYSAYSFECESDENGILNFNNCDNLLGEIIPAGTYYVDRGSETAFNSITITDGQGDSSEGGSEGGSSGGGIVDGNNGGLLSGGTSQLSGIITNLGNVISEFIPYVAYLGLGLLGAIIGFVAIKRLINWVRSKVFGTFSGGRRR